MRNHFLKTITMIGALIILSAVSGRAQAGAGFTVVVPFDFSVSGKVLPAGEYIVARSQPFNEGFKISAKEGSAGAFLQTLPVQKIENEVRTKVVFKRYGNEYFLSQIWISGRNTGRELRKSRQERALERELAARAVKPETIAVAGKAR
ncbi:MAG TPA: hypothetical protein VGJ55_02690 [Pyrinomonadaceae bacterium]|jgi:hypothetical protein